MDGSDFDALTRSVGSIGSRRYALMRLLGGALGLFSAHPEMATAKKCSKIKDKSKRKKCRRKAQGTLACPTGQKLCAGGCILSHLCCIASDCPPTVPTCCAGACINVQTDARHCGGCGAGCKINERCVGGQCSCPLAGGGMCDPGATCCPTIDTCSCVFGEGQFLDPVTCQNVMHCPAGATPCVATTFTCGNPILGGGPSRVCCPGGTTCTPEGTCRL
jgi:hypothetical protein